MMYLICMQGVSKSSSLNLRIPTWTQSNGAKATLNGQSLTLPAPGVEQIIISLFQSLIPGSISDSPCFSLIYFNFIIPLMLFAGVMYFDS